jgi:hypothetical protein
MSEPSLIRLWKTRDGTRCLLTRPTAGPPFQVIITRRNIERMRAFTTHDEATAYAIEEMITALGEAPDGGAWRADTQRKA